MSLEVDIVEVSSDPGDRVLEAVAGRYLVEAFPNTLTTPSGLALPLRWHITAKDGGLAIRCPSAYDERGSEPWCYFIPAQSHATASEFIDKVRKCAGEMLERANVDPRTGRQSKRGIDHG